MAKAEKVYDLASEGQLCLYFGQLNTEYQGKLDHRANRSAVVLGAHDTKVLIQPWNHNTRIRTVLLIESTEDPKLPLVGVCRV